MFTFTTSAPPKVTEQVTFTPFTPTTSVIKRFKSDRYITTPLILKLRYQQDGVVFMDYVTEDNFLIVIIRGGKPVVRYAWEGGFHTVTLTETQTLLLSITKDPSVPNKIQVQSGGESKTIEAPFRRLTSNQMRLGNSAPAKIRHGEFSKGFTGDFYWIRYFDSYIGSELDI